MAATYAEVATLTQRVADREIENRALRQRVTELRRTLHIPAWCGCTTEYVPVPVRGGGQLVPIWEPDQVANPLRRFAPPEAR